MQHPRARIAFTKIERISAELRRGGLVMLRLADGEAVASGRRICRCG